MNAEGFKGACTCDRHRNEAYASEEAALAVAERENDELEDDGEERVPWRAYCCPTSTRWHLSAATPTAFCRQWTNKNGTARRVAALLYLNAVMDTDELVAEIERPGWPRERVNRLVRQALRDFTRFGLASTVPGTRAATRAVNREGLLRVVYIGWKLYETQNPPVTSPRVPTALFDPSSLEDS